MSFMDEIVEPDLAGHADSLDTGTFGGSRPRTGFGTDLTTSGLAWQPGSPGLTRSADSVSSDATASTPVVPDDSDGGTGVSLPGFNPTGYSHAQIQYGQAQWDASSPPPTPIQPIQPAPSYSGEVTNTIDRLRAAKGLVARYLRGAPGVNGVNVGVCGNRACIKVYVSSRNSRVRIPTSVRGIPVVTQFGMPAHPRFGADSATSTPAPSYRLSDDETNALSIGLASGAVATGVTAGVISALGGKWLMLLAPVVGTFLGIPIAFAMVKATQGMAGGLKGA